MKQATESKTVADLDPPRGRWHAVRIRRRPVGDPSTGNVDRRPEPGESVDLSDLADPDDITDHWFSHTPTRETDPPYLFFSPNRASWGAITNYGGGPVERSNQRVFLRRHSDVEGVHETLGKFGARGVLVRGDVTDPGVLRDLRILCAETGYSTGLLDRGDLQELESELRRDAVRSWALDDFWAGVETRALSSEHGGPFLDRARRADVPGTSEPMDPEETLYHFLDAAPENAKRSLFWECVDRTGERFVFEQADAAYIDTATLASAVQPSDVLP